MADILHARAFHACLIIRVKSFRKLQPKPQYICYRRTDGRTTTMPIARPLRSAKKLTHALTLLKKRLDSTTAYSLVASVYRLHHRLLLRRRLSPFSNPTPVASSSFPSSTMTSGCSTRRPRRRSGLWQRWICRRTWVTGKAWSRKSATSSATFLHSSLLATALFLRTLWVV